LTSLNDTRSESAPSPIADRAPQLAVVRLVLSQFRSYAASELQTSGRSVVLAGHNGAGKTNVLEAISLLSPGRGLRGASLADHIRKAPVEAAASGLWAVAATVARGPESYELGTGLGLTPQGGERRRVQLNGAPLTNTSELAEIMQMVWLTPAMDRLFAEGASGRRRFLDRLVLGFDAAHARRAARYETAMRERLRLLKFGPRDPAWLDGLEREMAETGVAMAQARAETVERLNRALAERGSAGAFPCAQLALKGEADTLVAEDTARAEEEFRIHWAKARMRDAEARRTTFGPHASDLAVRHTEKRMNASDCSTGEQKALLISIVLADAWELARRRDGIAPLLLLDEVAAHLDLKRRGALFEEILALGAQAWMTGTDLSLFAGLERRADVFLVNAGQFVRQE
jgi:DNA replication and repair protein RecF